ncbi:sigma factor, partial [Streptomyces mirabilis]|uniref:RNA polymerase sigma factor n=1 Tax=Streptomyces mirabilis TaxID=68239 RepID=UPI0033F151FF
YRMSGSYDDAEDLVQETFLRAWRARDGFAGRAFVRGHALRVADSLQVPDSAYESALDDAPETVRRELLRAIVAGRRTALADRLLPGLRRDWGDAEAARLLPGCAPETVARLLPELFHAVTGWKTLAKRHPGTLLDVAEGELAALPEALRDTWWGRYTPGVAATVATQPLRVLDLLERFGPATLPLPLHDHFPRFAAADPSRLLRLLLTPTGFAARRYRSLSPAVLRRLARSDAPELPAFSRALAD